MRLSRISFTLWSLIPVLTTINQICIKLLAFNMRQTEFGWEWLIRTIQTPWALIIIICEVSSFFLWLKILSETCVSKAVPISAISYISIILMSWLFFNEPLKVLQVVGGLMILAGVWCIGTATQPKRKEFYKAT